MSAGGYALRLVAGAATLGGWLFERARSLSRSTLRRFVPTTGWKTIEAGGVRLRAPPDWSEAEADPHGGLVLHNRPRRFRVDGDAVWYSSAIELRIFRDAQVPARNAEAMHTQRRRIRLPGRNVTLEIAIANGVGPIRRAEGERVLQSAEAAL